MIELPRLGTGEEIKRGGASLFKGIIKTRSFQVNGGSENNKESNEIEKNNRTKE